MELSQSSWQLGRRVGHTRHNVKTPRGTISEPHTDSETEVLNLYGVSDLFENLMRSTNSLLGEESLCLSPEEWMVLSELLTTKQGTGGGRGPEKAGGAGERELGRVLIPTGWKQGPRES